MINQHKDDDTSNDPKPGEQALDEIYSGGEITSDGLVIDRGFPQAATGGGSLTRIDGVPATSRGRDADKQ